MSVRQGWIAFLAAALVVLAGSLGPVPARAQDTVDKKVTLTLKDAPLRTVVDQIFAGSGLQYAVDANVPDVPVTLNIRDVTLQSALRTVIKIASSQVPGLTKTRDGDVYIVKIRKETQQPLTNTEEAPPETQGAATETTWEKIPVQFNSVLAIMYGLLSGATGIIPTEAEILMGGQGGGGGGFGGGGQGGFGGGQGGFGGGGQGGFGGGGFGGGGQGGFGGGGFGGGGQGGFGGGGFGGGGQGGFGGGGFGGGGGGFGGGGGGFGGGGGGLGGRRF